MINSVHLLGIVIKFSSIKVPDIGTCSTFCESRSAQKTVYPGCLYRFWAQPVMIPYTTVNTHTQRAYTNLMFGHFNSTSPDHEQF